MSKTLSKLGVVDDFLNGKKCICVISTANILSSKRLNVFFLGSDRRQECLILSIIFYRIPEDLIDAIKQENEIKSIQIRKKI